MQKSIEIEVLQESILGPLLRLICVNDVFNALSCKTCRFTDGSSLALTSCFAPD